MNPADCSLLPMSGEFLLSQGKDRAHLSVYLASFVSRTVMANLSEPSMITNSLLWHVCHRFTIPGKGVFFPKLDLSLGWLHTSFLTLLLETCPGFLQDSHMHTMSALSVLGSAHWKIPRAPSRVFYVLAVAFGFCCCSLCTM